MFSVSQKTRAIIYSISATELIRIDNCPYLVREIGSPLFEEPFDGG